GNMRVRIVLSSTLAANLLLMWLLWAIPAGAQTAATGAVLGTVTDPGGAVAPGVSVELINSATNETRSTETNSSGPYVFPNVTPSTYNLKFTKPGFATAAISNIKVDVNKTLTYDMKLEISRGTEVVEVSATVQAELQTTDAQVGNDVSSAEIMNLPTL